MERKLKNKKKTALKQKSNELRVKACNDLAAYYNNHKQFANAIKEYEECSKIYEANNEPNLRMKWAGSQRMIGEMYLSLGNFDKALHYVNKHLAVTLEMSDIMEEIKAHENFGRILLVQGQNKHNELKEDEAKNLWSLAKKEFHTSLTLTNSDHFDTSDKELMDMQARILLNLSNVEEHLGNDHFAMNCITKAKDICKLKNNNVVLHNCYLTEANMHCNKRFFSEALDCLDKALELAGKLENKVSKTCETLHLKAEVLCKMSNYHHARKVWKKAWKINTPDVECKRTIESCLKVVTPICKTIAALELIRSTDNIARMKSYAALGDGARQLRNYFGAAVYYTDMLYYALKAGKSKRVLATFYACLYHTYEEMGCCRNALVYCRSEYELIKDMPKKSFGTLYNIALFLYLANSYFSGEEACLKAWKAAKTKNRKIIALKLFLKYYLQRCSDLDESKINDIKEQLRKLGYEDFDNLDNTEEELRAVAECDVDTNVGDDLDLEELTDDSDTDEELVYRPLDTKTDAKGATVLHRECVRGDKRSVLSQLSFGHPVRVRDHAGRTPLHEAAARGHLHIAEVLVVAGADVDAAADEDITPLYDAAVNGHLEVVQLLLDKGANPHIKTKDGKTALHALQIWRSHTKIAIREDIEEYYTYLCNHIKNLNENTEPSNSNGSIRNDPLPSSSNTNGTIRDEPLPSTSKMNGPTRDEPLPSTSKVNGPTRDEPLPRTSKVNGPTRDEPLPRTSKVNVPTRDEPLPSTSKVNGPTRDEPLPSTSKMNGPTRDEPLPRTSKVNVPTIDELLPSTSKVNGHTRDEPLPSTSKEICPRDEPLPSTLYANSSVRDGPLPRTSNSNSPIRDEPLPTTSNAKNSMIEKSPRSSAKISDSIRNAVLPNTSEISSIFRDSKIQKIPNNIVYNEYTVDNDNVIVINDTPPDCSEEQPRNNYNFHSLEIENNKLELFEFCARFANSIVKIEKPDDDDVDPNRKRNKKRKYNDKSTKDSKKLLLENRSVKLNKNNNTVTQPLIESNKKNKQKKTRKRKNDRNDLSEKINRSSGSSNEKVSPERVGDEFIMNRSGLEEDIHANRSSDSVNPSKSKSKFVETKEAFVESIPSTSKHVEESTNENSNIIQSYEPIATSSRQIDNSSYESTGRPNNSNPANTKKTNKSKPATSTKNYEELACDDDSSLDGIEFPKVNVKYTKPRVSTGAASDTGVKHENNNKKRKISEPSPDAAKKPLLDTSLLLINRFWTSELIQSTSPTHSSNNESSQQNSRGISSPHYKHNKLRHKYFKPASTHVGRITPSPRLEHDQSHTQLRAECVPPRSPVLGDSASPAKKRLNDRMPQTQTVHENGASLTSTLEDGVSLTSPIRKDGVSPTFEDIATTSSILENGVSSLLPNIDGSVSLTSQNLENSVPPTSPTVGNRESPTSPNLENEVATTLPLLADGVSSIVSHHDDEMLPGLVRVMNGMSATQPDPEGGISRSYHRHHEATQPIPYSHENLAHPGLSEHANLDVPLLPSTSAPSLIQPIAPAYSQRHTNMEYPEPVEPPLNEDLVELLGDVRTSNPLGPPIHSLVAVKWQEILCKGLRREEKEKIEHKYLVPYNCQLIQAPSLNPEVKTIIQPSLAEVDTKLQQHQDRVGSVLSALGSAVTSILLDEGQNNKANILQPLLNACRLLCDMHHEETETRRENIMAGISSDLKESLVNTARDRHLFGDNLRCIKSKPKININLLINETSGVNPNQPQESGEGRSGT